MADGRDVVEDEECIAGRGCRLVRFPSQVESGHQFDLVILLAVYTTPRKVMSML